jgi:hypothetical protein
MHLILIKNHTNAHLVNYTNVQQHCNTKRSILKISIPDKTFAEKKSNNYTGKKCLDNFVQNSWMYAMTLKIHRTP